MEYMLIFNESPEDVAKREHPTEAAPYWGAWNAYIGALNAAGVVVSGNGLQAPYTATHVRVRDGQRLIQDGPFADTREHIGGYFIIRVDALDQALEWAARSPSSEYGSTEVRPVLPPPQAQ